MIGSFLWENGNLTLSRKHSMRLAKDARGPFAAGIYSIDDHGPTYDAVLVEHSAGRVPTLEELAFIIRADLRSYGREQRYAGYDKRISPEEQRRIEEYMKGVQIHRPFCEVCGEGPYATPELMAMHMQSVHGVTAGSEDTEPVGKNVGFLRDPHDTLYPPLFRGGTKIPQDAINKLKSYVLDELATELPNPDEFIYFTIYGSGISYNWDEGGDMDIQMWVDVEKYTGDPMTADDLVAACRRIVQPINFPSFKDLGLTATAEGVENTMLIQYYPKPGKGTPEENLASKPYACYDLETGEWLEEPTKITPTFYGEHFLMLEPKCEDIALQAEALLGEYERNSLNWQFWYSMYERYDNPHYKERYEEAQEKGTQEHAGITSLFEGVFGGRAEAYSPGGKGIEDERDMVQKMLEVWGVFQKLKTVSRQPMPWDEVELPSLPENPGTVKDTGYKYTHDDDVESGHGWVLSTTPQEQAILDQYPGQRLVNYPGPVNVPGYGRLDFGAHSELQDMAGRYTQSPPRTYNPVDPERAARIAEEYERMEHKPDDPAVKASYDAFIKETMDQYNDLLRAGYTFEFYPEYDPYPNGPREAILDLYKNKHLFVYPTSAGFGTTEVQSHPLLNDAGIKWGGHPVTYNDVFRAVHDVFGHAKEGVGFRADGEENAWRQHAAMYSDLARPAMTAETRGQNSWVNYGPHGAANQKADQMSTVYAEQKAGIMPEWVQRDGLDDNPRMARRKFADYNGWTNWETWNTKAMIDNNGGMEWVNMSRQLAEDPEALKTWTIFNILGPYNADALRDAQEWNDIPYHERLDPATEELREKSEKAYEIAQGLNNAFGIDPVADTDPNIIDPEMVNWHEIAQHILADAEEERRHEEGLPPSWEMPKADPDAPGDFTLPQGWARVAGSALFHEPYASKPWNDPKWLGERSNYHGPYGDDQDPDYMSMPLLVTPEGKWWLGSPGQSHAYYDEAERGERELGIEDASDADMQGNVNISGNEIQINLPETGSVLTGQDLAAIKDKAVRRADSIRQYEWGEMHKNLMRGEIERSYNDHDFDYTQRNDPASGYKLYIEGPDKVHIVDVSPEMIDGNDDIYKIYHTQMGWPTETAGNPQYPQFMREMPVRFPHAFVAPDGHVFDAAPGKTPEGLSASGDDWREWSAWQSQERKRIEQAAAAATGFKTSAFEFSPEEQAVIDHIETNVLLWDEVKKYLLAEEPSNYRGYNFYSWMRENYPRMFETIDPVPLHWDQIVFHLQQRLMGDMTNDTPIWSMGDPKPDWPGEESGWTEEDWDNFYDTPAPEFEDSKGRKFEVGDIMAYTVMDDENASMFGPAMVTSIDENGGTFMMRWLNNGREDKYWYMEGRGMWTLMNREDDKPGDLTLPENWARTAAWADVQADAVEVLPTVQLVRNGSDNVVGQVPSQTRQGIMYPVEIWPSRRAEFLAQGNPNYPLALWSCECEWGQHSWGRTRQFKKFEGRPCKHVLATYWASVGQPVDDQPGFQETIPGMEDALRATVPGQQPTQPVIPGTVPQAPAAPEPPQSELTTPNDASPAPFGDLDNEQLTMPGTFSKWRRTSSFLNGDYVRSNVKTDGYDDRGTYYVVPRNMIGEVIWADDEEAIVIFSIESKALGPHNVRVTAPTESFSLVPRSKGTAPRRHR